MNADNEIWVSGTPSDQVRYEAQAHGGAVFIRGDGTGGIEYRVASAEEIIAELRRDMREAETTHERARLEQQVREHEQAAEQGRRDQAERLPTMPGEAPPGMDPATRRGQSQARDLTGPGRWPDITTTSHREDTEPMNDITDPTHRIESTIEQQMRSDFMHAWGAYPDNPEEYDPAAGIGYAEYADPWLSSDERWALDWDYLSDATLRWTEDPASAESQLALLQKCGLLSEVELRSEEQARYIAEHGIERDEAGQLTSHYVTRVQEREASAAGTPSALADYRPGNALSAHTTASERDGIDR